MSHRLIDAHAHLHLRPGAVDELLATMDANDIERTIVVAGGTIPPELLSKHFSRGGSSNVTIDNQAMLAACGTSGGRLFPFYFANPFAGTVEYQTLGRHFSGLKLAPIVHGLPFSDPRMQALISVAETFNHPVYLHCLPREGFEVIDLALFADRNPRVRFILGHGGVGHGDFLGISQIKACPNVYFEISGTFSHATRVAIKVLGSHRVLFGSEYPLQDPQVEITKLRRLGLAPDDLEAIERGNVLGLVPGLSGTSHLS